jgi:hypothetical protein
MRPAIAAGSTITAFLLLPLSFKDLKPFHRRHSKFLSVPQHIFV